MERDIPRGGTTKENEQSVTAARMDLLPGDGQADHVTSMEDGI